MTTNGSGQMTTKSCPAKRSGFDGHGSSRVSKPSRRGAAAVEFAIVAPIIFLFLFAGIEFCRLLMTYHGLEAAAQAGCRVAVAWETTDQDIEQTVAGHLAAFGISGYTLSIDPSPAASAYQWDPITVEIAVAYDRVSWLPAAGYLQGFVLSESCTLPQESDPRDS